MMGESNEVIDLKRQELVRELSRPIHSQDKFKINRLKEAIERHRRWEKERRRCKRVDREKRKRLR